VGRVGKSTLNRHLHVMGVSRRVTPDERADGPPYHRFEAMEPNALWHSDCHHGPNAIGADGKVVPTRIFAWIDDYSRMICHCEAYADESLPSLENCLRKAMEKFGVPRRVYTDLGSVYSGVQFALICADLGIRHVDARPYSPWTHGKIERLWSTQEDKLWSEIALVAPVPFAQLNKWLQAWVEAEYHQRVHGETGERPLERWTANRPAMLSYPTTEQLERLFWLWERRKVSATGTVQLCRNTYYADPALAGRKVVVRYDPFDLTRIQLWTTDRVPQRLGDATAAALLVRRRLNPPPPADTRRLSPAAQRRIARLEQRYEEHRAQQMNLIRYDTPEKKGEV
jgi:transposase InsO family protein